MVSRLFFRAELAAALLLAAVPGHAQDSQFGSASGVLSIGGKRGNITVLPPSALPAPTPTTAGGVMSGNAPSHQFQVGIDSSGRPIYAQPQLGDVSIPVLAGQLYTSSGNGQIGASGCRPIEAYGASSTATDATNVNALKAAFAALPVMSGGCISVSGIYPMNAEVDFAAPSGGSWSLMFRGVGKQMSRLNWTGATSGLKVTLNGQLQTVHTSDIAFTTSNSTAQSLITNGAATGTFGFYAYQTVPLGPVRNSSFINTTFSGADGGGGSNFWGTALLLDGLSYANVDGSDFFGAKPSSSTYAGIGLWDRCSICTSNNGNYTIVTNVDKANFQALDQHFIYGSYVQGVTINATNMEGGRVGIATEANAAGVLAQLAMTNSQIGAMSTAGFKENGAIIDQILLTNNTWYLSANSTAIDLSAGTYFFKIHDVFAGVTSSTGINIGNTNNGKGIISGSVFSTLGTGVILGSGSQNVVVTANSYPATVNQVVDNGTNNFVDYDVSGNMNMSGNRFFSGHTGHIQGAKPTISNAASCSTSLDQFASDNVGTISVGAGITCGIAFSKSFVGAPRCVVSAAGGSSGSASPTPPNYAVSPNGINITNPGSQSYVETYLCDGP